MRENPHWPLRPETVPELEKKITPHTSKEVIRGWFITHPPTTPHGLLAFFKTLSPNEHKQPKYLNILHTFWHTAALSEVEQILTLNKVGHLLTPLNHQQRIEFLLWRKHTSAAKALLKYLDTNKRLVYAEWIDILGNCNLKISPQNISHPGIATEAARKAFNASDYEKAAYYLISANTGRIFNLGTSFYIISNQTIRALTDQQKHSLAQQLAVKSAQLSTNNKDFQREFLWLSGWISTAFLNQHTQALNHLVQAASLAQSSEEQAQYFYWLSKASGALNLQTKSNQWLRQAATYPQTFYGQIAANKLKLSIVLKTPQIPTTALQHFLRKDIIQAIQLLHAAGQTNVKNVLIDALQDNLTNLTEYTIGFYFTAHYATPYYTVHYYEKVNKEINFATPDVFFNITLSPTLLFNRHFVHAMIFNESRFHPMIKSDRGALGLMQITPITGRHLANKGHCFEEERLYKDPEYNLQMGSIYLDELFKRFQESHLVLAAAYNAGPTYISTWIRKNGRPKDDYDYMWIEQLQYKETRNYTKKLMAIMRLYQQNSHQLKTYSPRDLMDFYLGGL